MIEDDSISLIKLNLYSKDKMSDTTELEHPPATTVQSNMISKLTEEAKMLHAISKELLIQSPIDYNRVNEIKAKLKTLDILKSGGQSTNAANRIAEKLIEMDKVIPK